MGVKGGDMPQLSGGSVIPVVVTADFSRSQSPEAVEARAFVSAENFQDLQSAALPRFYFWCLAEGGAVIERLDLVTTALGDSTSTAFPPQSDRVEKGAWFVGRSSLPPVEIFGVRAAGETNAETKARLGLSDPFAFPRAKMEMGGAGSLSNVWVENGGTPFPKRIPPDNLFWDPLVWAFDGILGAQAPELVLSPNAAMADNTRWFVPKGTGILFAATSFAVGGPIPQPKQYGSWSILWRESPQALGGS